MNIGAIGNNFITNNSNAAKDKVSDDGFEKRLQQAMDQKDEKELKKVCKEFEGILLGMMYKQMKATVQKSDLVPADAGKEVFESMLDEELVNEASRGEGYGLADTLYKQLSRRLNSTYKP